MGHTTTTKYIQSRNFLFSQLQLELLQSPDKTMLTTTPTRQAMYLMIKKLPDLVSRPTHLKMVIPTLCQLMDKGNNRNNHSSSIATTTTAMNNQTMRHRQSSAGTVKQTALIFAARP